MLGWLIPYDKETNEKNDFAGKTRLRFSGWQAQQCRAVESRLTTKEKGLKQSNNLKNCIRIGYENRIHIIFPHHSVNIIVVHVAIEQTQLL